MKIKLQEAFDTDIYETENGYICLFQYSNMCEAESVFLTPEQAERLIEALPKLIEMARLKSLSGDEE